MYQPAPRFDFAKGDFVRDGANRVLFCDGKEAYRQWCYKVLRTPKGGCIAYINTGIEKEKAMAQPTRQAVQMALEKTITEALLQHPGTERVMNFEFDWLGDSLHVGFTVKAKDLAAFDMDLNIVTS